MADVAKLLDEARDMRNKKANLSAALEKVNQVLEQDADYVPALVFKSIVLRDSGLLDEARTLLKQVLTLNNNADLAQKADAERLLGFLELLQGNTQEAQALAATAQETAETAEDKEMLANTLALLGNIEHTEGNLNEAKSYYEQALQAAQKARFVEREITVTINLATVIHEQGGTEAGLKMLRDIIKRSEDKWSKALFNAYYEFVRMHQAAGTVSEAIISDVVHALKQATSHGWVDEQGNLARQLGLLYKEQNNAEQAEEYFLLAKHVFSEAGIMHKVALIEEDQKD